MEKCYLCKKVIRFPGKYERGKRYVCRGCYFRRKLKTKIRIFNVKKRK